MIDTDKTYELWEDKEKIILYLLKKKYYLEYGSNPMWLLSSYVLAVSLDLDIKVAGPITQYLPCSFKKLCQLFFVKETNGI